MALESRLTSRGRILKNTTETVEVVVYDDGTAEAPTGTPTYTVTDAAGASVASGNVTISGLTTLQIPLAAQTAVKKLTIAITGTWNGASQVFTHRLEVVGGHLFSEAQARAFKVGNTQVLTAANYEDSELAEARDRITDLLERSTAISWVPRYGHFTFDGSGGYSVQLPDRYITSLISVTIGGTAQTIGNYDFDPDTGVVYAKSSAFTHSTYSTPRNVVIEYEYGKQQIEDGVDRIALRWLMATVVRNNTPDRAMTITNEVGNLTLAPFNPSGDPEVDAWVARHDERNPVG